MTRLNKKEQSELKGLSKIIYIFATIGKICMYIAIPCIILTMIIVPIIINNTNITKDNNIVFKYQKDTIYMKDLGNNKVEITYNDKVVDKDDSMDYKVFKKYRNTLQTYSKRQLIGYIEAGLILITTYLYLISLVLKHLAKLFKNINEGATPFTLDNVDHMSRMGRYMIAVIILPILASVLYSVVANIDLNIDFGFVDIIEVLFVLAMTIVFKYGYNIQEEVKSSIYSDKD